MYRRYFKRLIDVTASGCALLILAIPLGVITLWLHFANKGAGAFFLQERPGKDGKIFKIVKFKSMTDERDAEGRLLPDSQRLTKVGRFVRSTSIDELPQLWNVLIGEMSLIGPRPLRTYYLPWYTPVEAKRHNVRPGITGYAQTHGRNFVSWDERLALDVYYVDHLSFSLDVSILLKTIKNVVFRTDVEIDPETEGSFVDHRKRQLEKT
ncbi:MAG: sugar transferase [Bacteroidales bacterium]|nr:sugar transferase [Bacteroidales bacterium]